MSTILFTTKSLDGLTCEVLTRLAFNGDVKVVYSNQESINEDFISTFNIESMYDDDEERDSYYILGNEEMKKYDNIIIADMCITDELLRKVGRAPNINKNIKMFDHHEYAIKKGVNNYKLGSVQHDEYGELCSSSQLFYNYLKKDRIIESNRAIKNLVNTTHENTVNENVKKEKEIIKSNGSSSDSQFVSNMLKRIKSNPDQPIFEDNNSESLGL